MAQVSSGNLHSLTDVLKRTLFFFEAMSGKELAPYVRRKMLRDYSLAQVEEKVYLCLKQHRCFDQGEDRLWRLDLQGARENDYFYHLLLKKQQPLSLWEIVKSKQSKRKKMRRMIAEEANLISDGRFIQLSDGTWGLTEWDVDAGRFPLKHLIVKAFRLHPGGLSLPQLVSVVNNWRETSEASIEAIIHKLPYFEQQGDSIWHYSPVAHRVYDQVMKKYLGILRDQKKRWQWEREQWHTKNQQMRVQYEEASQAQREVAAALNMQATIRDRNNHLVTQISEKDLLLSLRKKEILYYQEQVKRLESKANSILYQCRLWVERTNTARGEAQSLRGSLAAAQSDLEGMFGKLQQYKERYREAQNTLARLKDEYSTRVAELQGEIIDLKSRMEKYRYGSGKREKLLEDEIDRLQGDLRDALEAGEDLQRSVRYLEQETGRVREEYRELERMLRRPLVRLALRAGQLFGFAR